MRSAKSYIDRKLTPPQAFFDWCYSQIPVYKWSNKQRTIISSERAGSKIIEKRLTKRSVLTTDDKFYSFVIVLVTKKRIEIQSYGFWARVVDGKELIEYKLVNFEQFSGGQHTKVTRWYPEQFVFGLSENYGFLSGPYTGSTFYENAWQNRVATISELKYLSFSHRLSHYELTNIYKYRREIEFLQKINAKTLARQVQYPGYSYSDGRVLKGVDMRVVNMKWLKTNKHVFKNSDLDFETFELRKRIERRGGKVVPGIERYLTYRDINKIPPKARIVNFQNWVIKHQVDFDYYQDYLSVLKDLAIVPNTDRLITPSDLTKAHDDYVKVLNLLRKEQRERAAAEAKAERDKKMIQDEKLYAKRLKQIQTLETEIDGYAFVTPKKLDDIVSEGIALSHCVGGSRYLDMHKSGRTTIIFVRKSAAVDEPLCTLEYRNGQIVQLQGYNNKSKNVPEDAKLAAEHWLEWTKTLKTKKKVGK